MNRILKSGVALVVGAMLLAACSSTSAPTVDATILADASGLVNVSNAMLAAFEQYDPSAISPATKVQIASLQTAATAAVNSLTASSTAATSAGQLQVIDAYLNAALSAVGAALPAASVAIPQLAPFVPMYDAAIVLVQNVIEPYVNSVITTATPTTKTAAAVAPLKPVKSVDSIAQARQVLGLK